MKKSPQLLQHLEHQQSLLSYPRTYTSFIELFQWLKNFFKILRWKGGGRKPPFSAGQMGLGGGFYFTSVKTFIEFI
jgi:hypothetical protein